MNKSFNPKASEVIGGSRKEIQQDNGKGKQEIVMSK